MKIEEVKNRRSSRAAPVGEGKGASATGRTQATEETSFVEQLGRFVRADGRQQLDRLLGRIDTAAGRLRQQFTLENVNLYKTEVSKFMRLALDQSYAPTLSTTQTKSGKTKQLRTARLVDEKIQGLIDEVLRRQAPITGYLHLLDEIRGLLVDLYE